uniref:ER membrane protein complex subunit 2 n=1 Tax=Haptolina brevifila TaxID=156173 RepID=A0A7S2NJY0_9EUKA|mmetsp:Transcript_81022/g.161059  ORF Transcript_81022/g.161059 Transcript_81022/m.161059 type:complete len:334 (+) Transcript_81022:123-1124(+)|eukprot:CAMPEP_0174705614 /NCGR_PEP_ID=MMETSP1094-20130205/8777_1 /TAXON_ID=156173 /ORGANISM="Chrysochromulina brevifilum, Strain UTEX LB 985" /LENGTH=333 /DNA_ID=CAMNT_0015903809 /DNA_START=109 /DNA_END=1110 /DNA_ORIENTATION=+
MAPPLAESIALAASKDSDPARCGFELCRNILLGVREARAHRPDLVLKYGVYLLRHYNSKLSHEVWAFYEQVAIALLLQSRYTTAQRKAKPSEVKPSAEMEMAQEFIDKLGSQFSESLRVKRLEAMMWEAKGELDFADKEYAAILESDPQNIFALKRQIAICRARGKSAEAARKLVDYLQTFCSDHEAYMMLHEIYLAGQQYKRASFCIEELVLINPMNYIYHLRAGDLVYTMGMSQHHGSHDQLLTARKYYAHALELKPGCLRALYGILLVCAALGTSTKGKGTKVDTAELQEFATAQLTRTYSPEGKAHPMRSLVLSLVKTLKSSATTSASG